MPAKLSIDNRLLEGLELRKMPVDQFAVVAALEGIRGSSKTVLNESFRDVRPLKNDVALQLWALWQEIDELASSFKPFTLSLKDGAEVHRWLLAKRAGTVYTAIITSEPFEISPEKDRERNEHYPRLERIIGNWKVMSRIDSVDMDWLVEEILPKYEVK